MLRNVFFAAAFALASTAALAADPQVEFDTTAASIKIELYPDARRPRRSRTSSST